MSFPAAPPRDWKIAIPSYLRAELASEHFLLPYAHLVIDAEQEDDYREAFARAGRFPLAVVTHKAKGIGATRNVILDQVVEPSDRWVVMLDDDVSAVQTLMRHTARNHVDPAFALAVLEATGTMAEDMGIGMYSYSRGARVSGWENRSALQPFQLRRTLDMAACGILDKDLRFGEGVHYDTLEDTDYGLRQLTEHRIGLWDNRYHWKCESWTVGGVGAYRSGDAEREGMKHLQHVWGAHVVRPRADTGKSLGQVDLHVVV